jgi:hypothetical protein
VSATRARVRQVRRDLRRKGCVCHPQIRITEPPRDLAALGVTYGAAVLHQEGSGCPLGAWAWRKNRVGIVPQVLSEPGCGR